MEGKRSNTEPGDILRKIGELTRSILEHICSGRLPSVYIDRFRNYCTDATGNCFCSSDLAIGKEVVTLQRECHARRLDVLLRVLLIVQQLLQESKHSSKRDIYYMYPSVFQEQSVVDKAINDICILLHCSRHNLNVVPVGNGWAPLKMHNYKFVAAYPIPVHTEEVKNIISAAHYVLVVEKESVFQRLANDLFCNRHRCIIITGRGYPDVPTRRFLRLLIEKLSLPAYCLVDCDPYGFDILTTYRFGSMQMAYDAKFLRIPDMHWLGAFPSDSEKYGLPKQCLLPLTAEDKSKIKAMLQRCYLQREVPHWRLELKLLLERGVKFEIEALSVHSISFLSVEYIPTKIKGVLQI